MSSRNYIVLDVETTTRNDGSPHTPSNRLCLVGLRDVDGYSNCFVQYDDAPYGVVLDEIRHRIERASLVVGFNIKFDLHWLKRYVPDLRVPNVFDCQLAEFLLYNQTTPYPSLNSVAERYGLGSKLDVVASEYWAHSIDTTDVPRGLLEEYTQQDVLLTEQVFLNQQRELHGAKRMLFKLGCEDLKILQRMEANGLPYNVPLATQRGHEARAQIAEIDAKLRRLANYDCINWNSNEHLSCLLYGGVISERYREKYVRKLKNGEKTCERWANRPVLLPRLVQPIARTETEDTKGLEDREISERNAERAGSGRPPLVRHWSVAEPVLRTLRPRHKAAKILRLMLERSKLEKLDSTYYSGLVHKMTDRGWDDGVIHGQFNQCVVPTGRLSSSGPNLQNFHGDIKELFTSRFE